MDETLVSAPVLTQISASLPAGGDVLYAKAKSCIYHYSMSKGCCQLLYKVIIRIINCILFFIGCSHWQRTRSAIVTHMAKAHYATSFTTSELKDLADKTMRYWVKVQNGEKVDISPLQEALTAKGISAPLCGHRGNGDLESTPRGIPLSSQGKKSAVTIDFDCVANALNISDVNVVSIARKMAESFEQKVNDADAALIRLALLKLKEWTSSLSKNRLVEIANVCSAKEIIRLKMPHLRDLPELPSALVKQMKADVETFPTRWAPEWERVKQTYVDSKKRKDPYHLRIYFPSQVISADRNPPEGFVADCIHAVHLDPLCTHVVKELHQLKRSYDSTIDQHITFYESLKEIEKKDKTEVQPEAHKQLIKQRELITKNIATNFDVRIETPKEENPAQFLEAIWNTLVWLKRARKHSFFTLQSIKNQLNLYFEMRADLPEQLLQETAESLYIEKKLSTITFDQNTTLEGIQVNLSAIIPQSMTYYRVLIPQLTNQLMEEHLIAEVSEKSHLQARDLEFWKERFAVLQEGDSLFQEEVLEPLIVNAAAKISTASLEDFERDFAREMKPFTSHINLDSRKHTFLTDIAFTKMRIAFVVDRNEVTSHGSARKAGTEWIDDVEELLHKVISRPRPQTVFTNSSPLEEHDSDDATSQGESLQGPDFLDGYSSAPETHLFEREEDSGTLSE